VRLQGRSALFYEEDRDDRDVRFLQRRDSRGIELGLLREFSRLFRASLTGRSALVHQSYDVFVSVPGVSDSAQQATRDSLANDVLKRYFDNGVALSLIRDTRDDRITADRGSLQSLIAEMAGGPLRGASSYQKLQLASSWYSPRPNGWTLAARIQGGVMGPIGDSRDDFAPGTEDERVRRVPKERRFYIGGVNSLRGWGENAIPGDGGLAMVLGNLEARIPLWGPFGAEVFLDAGNVWARPEYVRVANFVAPWDGRRGAAGDLRYSYGVGARLLLPFGPLRMDLTWCDHPEFDARRAVLGKEKQRFAYQFAIGPSF
jgi:outer membrane protein insertion porin family